MTGLPKLSDRLGFVAGALLALVALGCGPSYSARAKLGLTIYCPGAGNVDFGDAGIREGLNAAGYRGEVATYVWTISFNPAIDQVVRVNARLRASALARQIENYIDDYVKNADGGPPPQLNLVGLSAGSGVAIWALEDLKPGYQVDNVILLGSSLWYRYDVSKALPRIRGKIYNYYSSNDIVLAGPMKVFGTIDGVFADDGAGAVGLRPERGADRIVNIPWKPDYEKYGYYGGHMDSTSPMFVRQVLSQHLLPRPGPSAAPRTAAPSPPPKAPRAERPS
ncbi:MAG: hypothetical protein AB7Q17_02230 [Phycisphaerae bacterium]